MRHSLCLCVLLLAACRGGNGAVDLTRGEPSSPEDTGPAVDAGPGADDAGPDGGLAACDEPQPLELDCPLPEALPFDVEAEGFAQAGTAGILAQNPEYKTRNFDTYGLPTAAQTVSGRMARGRQLRVAALPGEPVSLWTWNACGRWEMLGRTTTDDDGGYTFTLQDDLAFGVGTHLTYAVLEGDRTCAIQGIFGWPRGTPIILTDIDGTLTLSDEELIRQIGDNSYDPKMYPGADRLMQTWRAKGFRIIYLTARPHDFRVLTHRWLVSKGFPPGPVITADTLVFDESARTYKREKIREILEDFGWSLRAVYGNANSDIDAYSDNNLPLDRTFIIGPNAGAGGTTAISEPSFEAHLSAYVERQPDADPAPVDAPFARRDE